MARIVIWMFVVVPLLYVLFVLGMRLVPPTPEQRRALALLEAPTPPVAGRDGTDAMWVFGHDVPVSRQAEIGKAYREYLAARAAPGAAAMVDPLASFPAFPKVPRDGESVCADHAAGCLAHVRENQSKVREILAAHQPFLQAALALGQFDGLRYGMLPTPEFEIPNLDGANRLARTHFAYEFVAGRPAEAIDGLCRLTAGWRRLGGNSDYLIASMIGAGAVRQHLQLLADMLAAFPVESAVPAACEDALAPTRDEELTLCPAMRTEFRFMRRASAEMGGGPASDGLLAQPWIVDRKNADAMLAEALAPFCTPPFLEAARADRSVTALMPPPPSVRRCAGPRTRSAASSPRSSLPIPLAMPIAAPTRPRRWR